MHKASQKLKEHFDPYEAAVGVFKLEEMESLSQFCATLKELVRMLLQGTFTSVRSHSSLTGLTKAPRCCSRCYCFDQQPLCTFAVLFSSTCCTINVVMQMEKIVCLFGVGG